MSYINYSIGLCKSMILLFFANQSFYWFEQVNQPFLYDCTLIALVSTVFDKFEIVCLQ